MAKINLPTDFQLIEGNLEWSGSLSKDDIPFDIQDKSMQTDKHLEQTNVADTIEQSLSHFYCNPHLCTSRPWVFFFFSLRRNYRF